MRDPEDNVTLPLLLPRSPGIDLVLVAEICWEDGNDWASWLLLMQWAGMPIGLGKR